MTDDTTTNGTKAEGGHHTRYWMLAVILAPVIYVFSFGPVIWLCGARPVARGRGWAALPKVVQTAYEPLQYLAYEGILGMWYEHYLEWFLRP